MCMSTGRLTVCEYHLMFMRVSMSNMGSRKVLVEAG